MTHDPLILGGAIIVGVIALAWAVYDVWTRDDE